MLYDLKDLRCFSNFREEFKNYKIFTFRDWENIIY